MSSWRGAVLSGVTSAVAASATVKEGRKIEAKNLKKLGGNLVPRHRLHAKEFCTVLHLAAHWQHLQFLHMAALEFAANAVLVLE